MENLIEKLKDKTYVRAFGLMSLEEQECFKKVGTEKCLLLCQIGVNARTCNWANNQMADFSGYRTYAIKPDYQPEPEYDDLEIKENGGYLGVWDHAGYGLPCNFTHLHCLPSLPNFEKFWPDINSSDFCFIEDVARRIDKGKTVYARLRKQ